MVVLLSLGLKMRKISLLLVCLLASVAWEDTPDYHRLAELPGLRFEVRMAFSGPPPESAGYTIERPARIVLDFPQVVSALKERRYPLSFDNGQSAMVLTTEGRTRLILSLDDLTSYTSRAEGNTSIVEVGANDGSSTNSVVTPCVNVPYASTAKAVSYL